MAKTLYCWRCKKDIPMLDEQEWEQMLPCLQNGINEMKRYRATHGATIEEAKQHVYGNGALQRYFEITGFRATNVDELWHHRISRLGPPCSACGKPLRTPQAKFCAECGMSASVSLENS